MSMHADVRPGRDSTVAGHAEEVDGPRSAGALLGNAAVLIWNDVANEGRERFYEWHDKEHIPERLALPGFRRGRRLVRPGHSPEWLTIYEADDLAAVTSPEYLARLNSPTPGTVSALKHFRNTSRAVCALDHSVGSSTGGHMLAMRLDVPSGRADAMRRVVHIELFPTVMALTGIVACHFLASDQAASYVDTTESSTRTFDVPSWVVLCEATRPAAAQRAMDVIDGPEFRRLGVAIRKDAATYGLEICRIALR
jgi:hypothetical protein